MKNKKDRTYIDGNIAVKPYAEPYVEPKIQDPFLKPKSKKNKRTNSYFVRRNQDNALKMNKYYFIFLVVVSSVCVGICISYISAHNKLLIKNNSVSQIKSQIDTLKTKNDSLEFEASSYVDFNKVCDMARKRLGMVLANKKQVVKYSKPESEYINQNDNIPDN